MTVADLIAELQEYDPSTEVLVSDTINASFEGLKQQ